MSNNLLTCLNDERRGDVRAQNFYGLDYLEVEGDESDQPTVLKVYFLGRAPAELTIANFKITGGRRTTTINFDTTNPIKINRGDLPSQDDEVVLRVQKPGDFSTYTLHLVGLDEKTEPIDPRYGQIDFNFRIDCPAEFDCVASESIPEAETLRTTPEINYLAKDYGSFRRLILDRLALTMPNWQERHIPDIGITLVEVLAYVGDHLSYYQDAVATEAYLDTARQRISIRRHARLVDYPMHEGCNARTWVNIQLESDLSVAPEDIYFITAKNNPDLQGKVIVSETDDSFANIAPATYEVFEPLLEPRYKFELSDIIDWMRLIEGLCGTRVLDRYLWNQFPKALQDDIVALSKQEPEEQKETLKKLKQPILDELNRLLEDVGLSHPSIYNNDQVLNDDLEIKRLVASQPVGLAFIHLNRLLLEAAYPTALYDSRKINLFKDHSEIQFYTWGDEICQLPRGATSATLIGKWAAGAAEEIKPYPDSGDSDSPKKMPPNAENGSDDGTQDGEDTPTTTTVAPELHLRPGDILIFEEVIGSTTGNKADADPAKRQAVRLTRIEPLFDVLYQQHLIEIEWAEEDALQFSLCLSAIVAEPFKRDDKCQHLEHLSVARGNVILVDHGRRIGPEALGQVAGQDVPLICEGVDRPVEGQPQPVRFWPHLAKGPLVFRQPLRPNLPASQMLTQSPEQAVPEMTVCSKVGEGDDLCHDSEATLWIPQRDLFESYPADAHVVAEVDNAGLAHLRFGNGDLGRAPKIDERFEATYRIGGGPAGHIGADVISHIVTRSVIDGSMVSSCCNLLPAQGGVPPETMSAVKQFAASRFRKQLVRAVTPDDYAYLAQQHPKVQRAAAHLRWNGSWSEILVVVDPLGTAESDPQLLQDLEAYLYPFRQMGHDVRIAMAQYISLDIEMTICVKPTYQLGHVKSALLSQFSNRRLAGGKLGFFHPDNLSFGEGIPLSKLVITAQAVPGVATVQVTKLERQFEGDQGELAAGILALGPLEVARLDNDPSFPEHGKIIFNMHKSK